MHKLLDSLDLQRYHDTTGEYIFLNKWDHIKS